MRERVDGLNRVYVRGVVDVGSRWAAGCVDWSGWGRGDRARAGTSLSYRHSLRHWGLTGFGHRYFFGSSCLVREGGPFQCRYRNVSGGGNDSGSPVWRLSDCARFHPRDRYYFRDCTAVLSLELVPPTAAPGAAGAEFAGQEAEAEW